MNMPACSPKTVCLWTAAVVALATVTGGLGAAAAKAAGAPCPAWATTAAAPVAPAKPGATSASKRTTLAALPALSYLPNGIAVGPTKAAIGAVVSTGAGSQAVIRYGRSSTYMVCGPVQRLGTGSLSGRVSMLLRELQPDTVYHFRLVARTAAGVVAGPERTFRTLAAGLVPQGVEVGSVPVGGKSRSQARALLTRTVAAPLRMSYAGAFWQVSRAKAGARVDLSGVLAAALTATPRQVLPVLEVKVDHVRLRSYVASLARRWGRIAATPAVRLVGTHALVTAAKRGVHVDVAKTAAMIAGELATGATGVVSLPVKQPLAATSAGTPQQKAVVIRLGSQTLTAYLDGKPVLETPITTGRPALPTPIGSYYIHFRASPYTFTSPWPPGSPYWYPPTPVTWAMFFFDGDFLHNDPGEPSSAYGAGSEYGPYASHGCVHVPYSTMSFLYNWLPVGATVIVSKT